MSNGPPSPNITSRLTSPRPPAPLFPLPPDGDRAARGPRDGNTANIIDRDILEETTANALGISVNDLQAAQDAGTRLPDLADELGVDITTVQAAVESAKTDMVNQALTDGLITTDQAEQILNGGGPRGGRGDADRRGTDGGGRGRGGFQTNPSSLHQHQKIRQIPYLWLTSLLIGIIQSNLA
ncbi:MAG TPA: hypothetical protein VLL52_20615 [Anaerolineae bacterium]|nr:hypothetical protein [Anaerolineae bacterium]